MAHKDGAELAVERSASHVEGLEATLRHSVLILDPLPGLRLLRAPRQVPPMQTAFSTLQDLRGSAIHPRVVDALCEISRRLTEAGVRHAVIGALAVGVYGWPRATKDVDLLLSDDAWDRQAHGELVPRVPLPEEVLSVPIDYLPLDVGGPFLEAAWLRPLLLEGVPIAPPEVVVCTKLLRLAMRDQADIVEVVKAGRIDIDAVARFLAEHTPMLVSRWEALVGQAKAEAARA